MNHSLDSDGGGFAGEDWVGPDPVRYPIRDSAIPGGKFFRR
jgi:hypothetical protein